MTRAPGGRTVRRRPAVVHEVPDRYVVQQHRDVRDQPAVAAPPDRLAAHHHGAVAGGERPGPARPGTAPARVQAAYPRNIGSRQTTSGESGARLAEAAEVLLPAVVDAGRWQPLLQRGAGDVRVPPAAGRGPHVDQQPHARARAAARSAPPATRCRARRSAGVTRRWRRRSPRGAGRRARCAARTPRSCGGRPSAGRASRAAASEACRRGPAPAAAASRAARPRPARPRGRRSGSASAGGSMSRSGSASV